MKLTITPGCQVSGGATSGVDFGTLDFGTWSLLNQNIDGQQDIGSQVSLACSTGEPYTIELDNGQNFSSTRKMVNSGNYVSYELYQDPSHTQRWGTGVEALPRPVMAPCKATSCMAACRCRPCNRRVSTPIWWLSPSPGKTRAAGSFQSITAIPIPLH